MATPYPQEIEEIEKACDDHPEIGSFTLSGMVNRGELTGLSISTCNRPRYSTYSVIRRYRAKKQRAQQRYESNLLRMSQAIR